MNSAAPSPSDPSPFEGLLAVPNLAQSALELLWRASHTDGLPTYLSASLASIAAAASSDYVALATAVSGQWSIAAETGSRQPLLTDLLAESLDREAPRTRGQWIACPLTVRDVPAEALLARCRASTQPAAAVDVLSRLGPFLRDGMNAVRQKAAGSRRIDRLNAILELAKQWGRTSNVERLLVQMAEAATRLLGADRASIFLWDRRAHMLIGRPALGVKDGELRIADHRGVVGQVIQTGRPCRVDALLEPDLIDRNVDVQLAYQTRSLLCVPLHGASGELFGAFELINKLSGTFTEEDESALAELAALAAVALENARDRQQLLATNRQITQQAADRVRLIGESPSIIALRSMTQRVADTDLAVLILGENGTGKEVVAQSIHYGSRRRDKPFIAVNCAAIPENLAESELFGHEQGAFTDAREARPGKFELAAGGTLFLDEIGDLTLGGQAKLLRVLEEKVLVRVGGSIPIHTDVRVIAATNQNLAEMVRQKRFREDLYFRLNVVSVELSPLRDRRDDILLLARHFLADFCARARRPVPEFSPEAEQRLLNHSWPGNVRELRNLMERLAYLSSEERIESQDLAFILSPREQSTLVSGVDQSLAAATDLFQREYIRSAIKQAGGNMSDAAARLGLHRSNLYRKMRQLGMSVPS